MNIVFAAAVTMLILARGASAQDTANRPDYNYRGIANPGSQPAGRQLSEANASSELPERSGHRYHSRRSRFPLFLPSFVFLLGFG